MGGLNGTPVVEGIDLSNRSALRGRQFGVYPALVTDIVDGDGQGRVRVRLPASPDTNGSSYEAWARLATMMGG